MHPAAEHHPLPLHLVGSLPPPLCADPVAAMSWFLRHRGDVPLTALPYERDPRWIIDWLTDGLAAVPALERVHDGESRDYEDMPRYRVREGHLLSPGDVAPGRPAQAEAAFAALAALDPPEPVRVQVGIPNALDLALFAFGSVEAAQRHLPTVQAAVAGEVAQLAARWGDRVQLQLETPAVLISYHRTPREAWPPLTAELVRQVTGVLAAAPHVRWVLHLCYGDLGHVPVFTPTDLEPAVEFLNALADAALERRTPMPVVHLPVTHGDAAPPTDPAFYGALRRLRRGIAVIAGVVAENHPEQTRRALDLTARALGGPVAGVAAACGYGRRTPAAAAANMALAVRLVHERTPVRAA
ncbi:hypothetical protein [Saccharothrix coeruleofusca]|uniref:Methionine synthase n=1 Tax=Saccharothrix coeruleofusca TaxID=33919 RepID=A0A918ASL4_9PSEU|nr:hypothetical protein [Saccharothrix coeruleofusca]MBP2336884.1 hypothetical protein [Saccharothrix coeruleofusca]GGP82104.1 hypothetical protein GCM10010185_65250 [Saccharothrix coeruleofusca]